MTPSPSPSSAVRAAVDAAEVHYAGMQAVRDMPFDWYCPRSEAGRRRRDCPECVAEVALDAVVPHLLAAIKAIDELADDWAERSEDWAEAGKVHRAEGRTLETSRCAARSWAWGEAASEVRAALALAAVDVTETAE